jgi:hypothetical protein
LRYYDIERAPERSGDALHLNCRSCRVRHGDPFDLPSSAERVVIRCAQAHDAHLRGGGSSMQLEQVPGPRVERLLQIGHTLEDRIIHRAGDAPIGSRFNSPAKRPGGRNHRGGEEQKEAGGHHQLH